MGFVELDGWFGCVLGSLSQELGDWVGLWATLKGSLGQEIGEGVKLGVCLRLLLWRNERGCLMGGILEEM